MTSRRHKFFNETDLKIYIIGDEDSVVGFLLAGIGFRDGLGKKNFFIVNSKTNKTEIEEVFKEYTSKNDCGVILMNQQVSTQGKKNLSASNCHNVTNQRSREMTDP
ncbi:vacuolar ATP synthase subunit F [Plasmodium cynomolgi strain B]|uniref:Vacuolar ATP synthase subunit F n=1 Tax=Plasmodium cynomolgi (strain B) TaxID=1120755 RepID=K6VBV1_PLACD|nr:vacuolar ATP synthase subunit F [Plasmodium cynomolgi strain B]GAB66672.1 vacuolar ATP synthase subunit F [Plasmodium cynomolgi strain B]